MAYFAVYGQASGHAQRPPHTARTVSHKMRTSPRRLWAKGSVAWGWGGWWEHGKPHGRGHGEAF